MKTRILLLAMLVAISASASTINFSCITNNTGQCSLLTTQITGSLTNNGNGTVTYLFSNLGPLTSSVTEVYWDDPTTVLVTPPLAFTQNGVNFSFDASPSVLPGGNGNPINFVATFGMAANNPPPEDGIQVGDSLSVTFHLGTGASFSNADALRVGLHVQDFETKSESLLYTASLLTLGPPPDGGGSVPEPATNAMFGMGFIAIATFSKRRFAGQKK